MNTSPEAVTLLMFLDFVSLTIWACYSIWRKM